MSPFSYSDHDLFQGHSAVEWFQMKVVFSHYVPIQSDADFVWFNYHCNVDAQDHKQNAFCDFGLYLKQKMGMFLVCEKHFHLLFLESLWGVCENAWW